jgi:hypothetical protein
VSHRRRARAPNHRTGKYPIRLGLTAPEEDDGRQADIGCPTGLEIINSMAVSTKRRPQMWHPKYIDEIRGILNMIPRATYWRDSLLWRWKQQHGKTFTHREDVKVEFALFWRAEVTRPVCIPYGSDMGTRVGPNVSNNLDGPTSSSSQWFYRVKWAG